MNRVEQRRADVLRVVDRYGTFAAIPGLAFNEEGLMGFRIDEVELTVTLEPDAHLSFRSVLDLGGIALERPFLLRLLSVNVTAARRGMGSVGIDEDAGAFVWIDRADVSADDAEDFHARLNEAARWVRFWRARIGTLAEQREEPPITDFAHFQMLRG